MTVAPPSHIALIMDGNGRWANARGLPRSLGHREGVKRIPEIVSVCLDLGIRHLTLFAFSSENWRRPRVEVDGLIALFRSSMRREIRKMKARGVRLLVIGDRSTLPAALHRAITAAEEATSSCASLTLAVAFSYGGRGEIAAAAKRIAQEVENGSLTAAHVTPSLVAAHLDTPDLPDPDLLIRTGGEYRISNFRLWQLAYTELLFLPELWPDFTAARFREAIAEYGTRERRYGTCAE